MHLPCGTSNDPIKRRRTPTCKRDPIEISNLIDQVLAGETPEEILGVAEGATEEDVNHAWKQMILLLHPDKLQELDQESMEHGAEALHRVHEAKKELRARGQKRRAEVPDPPLPAGPAICIDSNASARKYVIQWQIPEKQDPVRPVEKYEVWGPRYFSEGGDCFDSVTLATVSNLESTFVFVEEAPTQQDVMWAADRVLRKTLPISIHAVNGKGTSDPLIIELPWSRVFPWLRGQYSVICPLCQKVQMSRGGGVWTKCTGCGAGMNANAHITIRCNNCSGEVLWSRAQFLSCTCCFRRYGEVSYNDQDSWRRNVNTRIPPRPSAPNFPPGAPPRPRIPRP